MIGYAGKWAILPRINIKIYSNNLSHKPFLSSIRRSTTVADESVKVSEKDDLESHLFPWRNRPVAFTHNVTFPAKFFLNTMNYSKDDFLTGAQAAFECAVSAIFQNDDLLKHNESVDVRFRLSKDGDTLDNPSSKELSKMEKEETLDVPLLEDIVDDRLTVFYGNAVKKMLLQPNRKIVYKLLRVISTSISRGDLLLYSDVDRVEHEFLVRHDAFYGLCGSLHPQLRKEKHSSSSSPENENGEEKQHADSIITNLKSSKSRSRNNADFVLLRLWVDLRCNGIVVSLLYHFKLLL
jgi:hypothetical protein